MGRSTRRSSSRTGDVILGRHGEILPEKVVQSTSQITGHISAASPWRMNLSGMRSGAYEYTQREVPLGCAGVAPKYCGTLLGMEP